MCFFDEKISDALLVGLQDFEFAVSCLLFYFVESIMCNNYMFISFQRMGRREGSTIILKRQESWTTFWEIFTIKFLVLQQFIYLFHSSPNAVISYQITFTVGAIIIFPLKIKI